MNELQRLETALRNAHAAGDVAAAAHFAQAIRELQRVAPDMPAPSYDRAVANDGWRDVPPPTHTAPASPVQGGTFGGSGEFAVHGGAGREFNTPHDEGRAFAATRGPAGAAIQGAGSMMFGVGTPIAAADEYVRSRTEGHPKTWEQSLEFARGLREGSLQEEPAAYAAGAGLGLASGAAAGEAVLSKVPAAIKSVFTLQKGQTIKNIARLMGTGAATAGVTAGMQEGSGAVVPAAEVGAVAAPVVTGLLHGAVGLGQAIGARIDPESAAIRVLAKKFKESASNIADLYNKFVERTGRKPGLAEIATEVEAGRIGQVGAQYSEAGNVFRSAEEAAANARPRELQVVVNRGGRSLTVPEQATELPPLAAEAKRVVGSRVNSTAQAQLARRDASMDATMGRIGDETVHLTESMKDVLEHQDIQSVLPAPLKRRINDAIQNGMDLGSIDIPLRTWEMMRYEMAKRAGGPGASQIYSQFRDRIRDYAGGRIPEYAAALTEFGRRSVGAEATTAAEGAVTGSAREFADMLRIAGTGDHGTTARATTRVGVRNWLANQLSGTAQQAARVMSRLARDGKLAANLRTALSPEEASQLAALGEQYGWRQNIIDGIETGQKVLRGDGENFAAAVATAKQTPGGAAGVRGGARAALAAKAGESPASATATAAAFATHPGLQDRIATALGAPEATRLARAGESFTQSARNLRAATPGLSQAQQEADEAAQKIQTAIAGGVASTGKASAAFKAHLYKRMISRIGFGSAAAQKLAEYATDPALAPEAIRRLYSAGVSAAEIAKWYQEAAAMTGAGIGGALGDNKGSGSQ